MLKLQDDERNNPYFVQYKIESNESGGDEHLKCMLILFGVFIPRFDLIT